MQNDASLHSTCLIFVIPNIRYIKYPTRVIGICPVLMQLCIKQNGLITLKYKSHVENSKKPYGTDW